MILTKLPQLPKPAKHFNLLYLDDHEYLISSIECKLRSSEFEREDGKIHLTTRSLYFQPNSQRIALLKFKLNSFSFSFSCNQSQTDPLASSRASKLRTETNSPKYQPKKPLDRPGFCITVKRYTLVTRDKITPAYSQPASEKFEFETSKTGANTLSIELDNILRYNEEEGLVNFIFDLRYKELTEIIQSSEEFDSDEVLMEKKVTRLTFEGCQLGAFFLTNRSIYYYGLLNVVSDTTFNITFSSIIIAIKYKHLHRDTGLSIFTHNFSVIFLFENSEQRNSIYEFLLAKVKFVPVELEVPRMTEKWKNGSISNFEYLMFLNHLSHRSVLNPAQYPVFPWVLKNYHAKGKVYSEINLNQASNYRDLGKPVGALNETRLIRYQARFKELEEEALYPILYSNTTTVFYYLIRKHPEIILRQQNSIFSTSDKLFESIEKSFGSSLNQFADLKELIPEFYSRNPDFLVNCFKMEISGEKSVKNVELPEWAGNAEEFCGIMRTALESDTVSESLHLWVDLVFGVDQQSESKFNSFNPECLDCDWSSIRNENQRSAYLSLLKEYGVIPTKIFDSPSASKVLKISVLSPYSTEQKQKIQKILSQIMNLTQIHNKEFKAQEKQYKQLLSQEMLEKNKETQELKNQLNRLNQEYLILQQEIEESFRIREEGKRSDTEGRITSNMKERKGSQKKLNNKDSEKNLFSVRKNDLSAGKHKMAG